MEKDGQQVIEIQATPLSNDVVGLQDLYLQLDTSNSTFEMVSDEIASGLDPSASNYIVSSSYADGNLVRAGGPDKCCNYCSKYHGIYTPLLLIVLLLVQLLDNFRIFWWFINSFGFRQRLLI